ncbi:MAG: TRAP transporter substrate-binding protein DctP [Peptococcaceae bacterium]|nr:TRAP transporter substrate-binding protein DctP [Peptococcaceae bacterium]
MKSKQMVLWIVLVIIAFVAGNVVGPITGPVLGLREADPKAAVINWTLQMHGPSAHPMLPYYQAWAKEVGVASGGRLNIVVHPVGTVFPLMETFTAVTNGALDGAIMWGPFWRGISPKLALSCGQTPGLTAAEFNTWLFNYGGWAMIKEMYAGYNIHWTPAIPVTPEIFLWAHKPIRTVNDLRGLKVRAAGFSLDTFTRLGAAATFLPGGETPPALMTKVVDAGEFGSLTQDLAVGFHEAAKFAMTGTRAPMITDDLLINADRWKELPLDLQILVTNSILRLSLTAYGELLRLDQGSVQRAKDAGVTFVPVSDELNLAFRTTLDQILDEEAAKDPMFAKIWNSQKEFRRDFRQFRGALYPWQ